MLYVGSLQTAHRDLLNRDARCPRAFMKPTPSRAACIAGGMLRRLGIAQGKHRDMSNVVSQPTVNHRVDGQPIIAHGVDGQSIVEHRLRWRTLLAGLTTTAITLAGLAAIVVTAQQPHLGADAWRTAAILLSVPLATLVMACVSPAASSDDLSPMLERGMLYASFVEAVLPSIAWGITRNAAPSHPCHSTTTLPSLLMCLACASVPLFGMRNALHFWPAHRCAMVAFGGLQLARTVAQARALRLANAAAALGLSELLPLSLAAQCQAHPRFQPGGVSHGTALGFGLLALLTGLALTPAMRMRLAILLGRFGLPAARVLHLGDGISLEPDETALAAASQSSEMARSSSGPFTAKTSLWSGWSAKWSDSGETEWDFWNKLSVNLRDTALGRADFGSLQEAICAQKKRIAEAEASKAKRRAVHHGKAYGKLVWLLLRRAQRCPDSALASIPRDVLRILVGFVAAAETARLDHLYSSRLVAGARSWRGPSLSESTGGGQLAR
jgi:hypothetical protein